MKLGSTEEMVLGDRRDVEISFPLVPEKTEQMLSKKELVDYTENRKALATWLLMEGKDPQEAKGYSTDTVKRSMYRLSYCERVIWREYEQYIPILDHGHADQYVEALAYSEKSQSHKHGCLHALKRYFKWRHHKYGEEDWEPARSFASNGNGQQPQDYFTKEERFKLRQAALQIGEIPSYSTVKADGERLQRLKPYVAEYRDKPTELVSIDDWDGVESWKFTSLVWTSLDAGLRPAEVAKASTKWLDLENNRLLIPKEDSTKNEGNWKVALHPKTSTALENWRYERRHYPKYDDTDKLWLTTQSKPYGSNSLRNLLHHVCDKAGIETENRKVSWYSIRHSVGTYMTDDRDLASTKEQLRHKRPETTMKYDAAPTEDRTDSLTRMG
jgi:integrase